MCVWWGGAFLHCRLPDVSWLCQEEIADTGMTAIFFFLGGGGGGGGGEGEELG